MKIVVATCMRVGSTLVCEVLSRLTQQPWRPLAVDHLDGTKITDATMEAVLATEGVVKTHSIPALDFSKRLRELQLFYTIRNFPDTVVSRALYEKNVRQAEGLPLLPQAQKILNVFPNVDNETFCNMFVEMNYNWLVEEASIWRRYTHLLLHPNVVRIDYDKIGNAAGALVSFLATKVETTNALVESTKVAVDPKNMQKRYTPGFANVATIGRAREILSPLSMSTLQALAYNQTKKGITV